MKNILSFTLTLITSAIAIAACVDTTTSTCADGARCPTGKLCVEGWMGLECVPPSRVEECANKDEGRQCNHDEQDASAVCRAGICTLIACGDDRVDWNEVCDDGNRLPDDGCSADCQLHCGNGMVEDGEFCDVEATLSESCLDRGFDMGTLVCASGCQELSLSSCIDFDWKRMQNVLDDWHFAGVWVFSPEHAVALGIHSTLPASVEALLCEKCGGIFEYDGTSWQLREKGIPFPTDLWANGPEDIYAVGAFGNIWHYNGEDWARTSMDRNYHLGAIWGTGPSNLFAVGAHSPLDPKTATPAILRYDGNAWTPMVLPDGDPPRFKHWLRGIWGSGADNVFAVGSYGTILHYDGNDAGIWTRMEIPPSIGPNQIFLDVWGTHATDVTVVGDQGTILRYDGHEWSPMISPTDHYIAGVWGTPAGRMFAVGAGGTLLSYDPLAGTEWRMMASGTSSDLTAIHGNSADNILAVGIRGAVLRLDQHAWAAMDLDGNQTHLGQIWGSGLDCMYAVDARGQIWHYDGNANWRWTRMNPEGNHPSWRGIHGLGCEDQIFVVGSNRRTSLYRDGAWTEMLEPEGLDEMDLRAVWVAGPDEVFAVGPLGTILHYDGNPALRWELMDSGVQDVVEGIDTMLTGVWGTSPSDVFAVGTHGTILHYDGTWTRMDSGVDWMLNAVWGTAPDNVVAVGETTVLHYDGRDWTSMDFPFSSETLKTVWGSSKNHFFAASKAGRLFHYDGIQWSPMRSPTDVEISSIWGTSDGRHIFVADARGRVFRLALPPAALPAD
jgi:cysteine-rich repeat protein